MNFLKRSMTRSSEAKCFAKDAKDAKRIAKDSKGSAKEAKLLLNSNP